MDVNIYVQALKPQQVGKPDANYREFDIPAENCGNCTYMNEDGTCQLVTGTVDKEHVCDFWEKEAT